MHTIIADLVDSQGGSEYLLKVLNRLGSCISEDSLKRFIQTKLKSQEVNHPCEEFFQSIKFKVVSADNIDWQHPFSRVYKGAWNHSSSGAPFAILQWFLLVLI